MIPAKRIVATAFAIAACTSPDRSESRASPILAAGDSLYVRGAFDSAHTVWTQALDLPGVRGTADGARLIANLALVAYRRGDYATARQLGDSALALKQQLALPPRELAESRNALGLIAWDEGRLGDATTFFERAITEYHEAGDQRGVAKASNNLGNVVLEYGRFQEARDRFAATRATGRALGDARIEGRATTNLAMLELLFGDPRTTISLVAEARALARAAGDPLNEENALGQLALGWSALGEPGRAIATADSALAIARRHGLREDEAEDLVVMAALYASAGDPDRALRNYSAARALYDTLQLPVEAATVLRHESLVRASRGAVTQALADIERALVRHREGDARFETFQDLLALARTSTDAGLADRSDRWLVEAERTAADLEGPQVRAALALHRARLFDARREPARALAAVDAAASDLETADVRSLIEADWMRTRSHAALGALDSASSSARRVAALIERVAGGLSSLTLRVGYRADHHRVLADVVLTLLRAGSTEEAFRIAESGRGRALREDLARARGVVGNAAVGPTATAMAERERLLREIDALVAQLAAMEERPRTERGAEWPRTSGELARRIRETRSAYEALVLRQVEAEPNPRRRSMVGAPPVDASAVRAILRPGEALVEYFATRDTLVIFAMTRERLRAITVLIGSDDLEQRVRLVRGLIAVPERGTASREALEGLHALLVVPLARAGALSGVNRLILVPHGTLGYLPFAALRDARTGRVLADEFVLENLPAAGMLPSLRRPTAPARSDPRTAVFAPFPDRLPATRGEVDAIARLKPRAAVYRGAAATEARLRRALNEAAPVHVATHGAFTASNPMFSSITLARGSGDSRDDGRLELHEILDLPVRSPLVFLSGCETALGAARATPFDRVEDVATLAEAFLLAGAAGAVATLWRIDDAGAAYFAERFYRHLADRSPAEALVATQRELMRHPRWADPYYWAAYSLVGDGVPMRSE